MTNSHESRRVRMTKQLMRDALLDLLEQQVLANITVTAICETADVHRSTFYKYYKDPPDLLHDIEHELLDRIPVPPKELKPQNMDQLLDTNIAFFDDVKQNRKTYKVLFSGSTGNSFATKLVEYLCDGFIPVGNNTDELSGHFIRLYIANGTVGMLREWVNKDFPISSHDIASMMLFLSLEVISSLK